MRSNMARIIAAVIAAAGGTHQQVPNQVKIKLGELYSAANFSPERGYERVLARRGANNRNSKPARGRRLNQASAKARQRWKHAA